MRRRANRQANRLLICAAVLLWTPTALAQWYQHAPPVPSCTPGQFVTGPGTCGPTSGANTVSNGLVSTGNGQGTALLLPSNFNTFLTVALGTGTILPIPVAGQQFFITNQGINPLTVYPASGGTIDQLVANAPVQIAAGSTAQLIAVSAIALNTVP